MACSPACRKARVRGGGDCVRAGAWNVRPGDEGPCPSSDVSGRAEVTDNLGRTEASGRWFLPVPGVVGPVIQTPYVREWPASRSRFVTDRARGLQGSGHLVGVPYGWCRGTRATTKAGTGL